jgi:hypothetical protein
MLLPAVPVHEGELLGGLDVLLDADLLGRRDARLLGDGAL